MKLNRSISYQIEHKVIDYNKDFNIALIEFETSFRK